MDKILYSGARIFPALCDHYELLRKFTASCGILRDKGHGATTVIEAGSSVVNNINVTDVGGYGNAFDTPIDWAYQTTNQTYVDDGATKVLRAGKAVGGTSTINGICPCRGCPSRPLARAR